MAVMGVAIALGMGGTTKEGLYSESVSNLLTPPTSRSALPLPSNDGVGFHLTFSSTWRPGDPPRTTAVGGREGGRKLDAKR